MDRRPRYSLYSLRRIVSGAIGIIALLALAGVAVVTAEHRAARWHDETTHRLIRGTIHLERLNGLVYDVVMESRGIYMSPDWQTAEQYGRNIPPALAKMQQIAEQWKVDAAAGQQANVEELGRRIDQFVRFRTELVRLGKEDSTAAARQWGDNDANRNVRILLNRSLEALAGAYEHDLAAALRDDEASDLRYTYILATLAGTGAVMLFGMLMLIRQVLLAPLLRLRDRIGRLAEGDLDTPVVGTERAIEFSDMGQSVEVFRGELIDRRRLTREAHLLSALNEWLQSCNSLSEVYDMTRDVLQKLLPDINTKLFVYSNSRDVLECSAAGSAQNSETSIHAEDCWALRRGHTYVYGEDEIGFPCAHAGANEIGPYCCIPILAQGETIGLLHLASQRGRAADDPAAAPGDMAEARRLGSLCAEAIGLTIANVRLRERLREQSIRDPLTGLFNRRYLMETGLRETARAVRTKQSIGVLSIDIDHFKQYNDAHGHDAGDTVLRAVGGCMQTAFRNEDVPCRAGGEEFVVILPGADADVALRRAEQLRTAVESLAVRYLDQNLPRVTISVGVATFPEAGDSLETVLRAADEAMYRAKAQGRNRVEEARERGSSEPTPANPPPVAAVLPPPSAEAVDIHPMPRRA